MSPPEGPWQAKNANRTHFEIDKIFLAKFRLVSTNCDNQIVRELQPIFCQVWFKGRIFSVTSPCPLDSFLAGHVYWTDLPWKKTIAEKHTKDETKQINYQPCSAVWNIALALSMMFCFIATLRAQNKSPFHSGNLQSSQCLLLQFQLPIVKGPATHTLSEVWHKCIWCAMFWDVLANDSAVKNQIVEAFLLAVRSLSLTVELVSCSPLRCSDTVTHTHTHWKQSKESHCKQNSFEKQVQA